MNRSILAIFASLAFFVSLASAAVFADDLLPAERPVETAVDAYVDQQLSGAGVKPAPPADDANLLRRTMLDLVGRIPTLWEAQSYAASTDPQKRVKLVERLMASPGFVRHQVDKFDALLMQGSGGSLRNYLQESLQAKLAWDQVYRELLLGRVEQKDAARAKEAGEFLKRRVRDLDKLTNDVSTIFFGVNVSCAKCHDHPLVEDWKQDHFFGMKSFFSRTFDNGGFLGERDYGNVKFKTTKGEERQAKLMFLSGGPLDEPPGREPGGAEQKAEKKRLEELKKKKQPPPPPSYSRRARLVEVALKQDPDRFLARSIVNRLWYRLLGRGLVMPVDQMHSENPSSHPQLLAWLARDLVEHGYDLRRLMRGLVLSRTYARGSRWEKGDRPPSYLFAVALPRPLTPAQLGASLRLAASDPNTFAGKISPEELQKRIEQAVASGRSLSGLFESPYEDFQVSVNEALLFSNSDRIARELLAEGGGKLISRLKETADRQQALRTAVWNVLSRPAEKEELAALSAYLNQRKDRATVAYQQIVWALLSGAEFRFNH